MRDVLNAGVGHVPEDRQRHGLVLSLSIADNLVLDQLDSPQYKSWSGRKLKAIEENGIRRIAEYDIRAQDETEPLSALSGGNQQKVVMARELSRDLKVLICPSPLADSTSVPSSSCTARSSRSVTKASRS